MKLKQHGLQPHRQRMRGLGAIAAIVVLVVMAVIAAAVVRLGAAEQLGFAQQLNAARASQAANAGAEWGLYQALRGGWSSCSGASQTLNLSADSGTGGMVVTVSCNSTLYNEGESSPGSPQQRRVFTIDAVACNSTSCPDASRAVTPTYVERRRLVQATDG